MNKDIKDNSQDYISEDKEIFIIGNLNSQMDNEYDEDMFIEIIRVNNDTEENLNKDEYAKILEKLEEIRPSLSEEQQCKLDKALKAINKEE